MKHDFFDDSEPLLKVEGFYRKMINYAIMASLRFVTHFPFVEILFIFIFP